MRLFLFLQEIPNTVDPKREALQNVFGVVVGLVIFAWLAYFAAYILFLRRTTPEKKTVHRGYIVVGPFVVLVMALTFLLYLGQYHAIHTVFRQQVSPARIFAKATADVWEDRNEEIKERILAASKDRDEKALEVAWYNFQSLQESGYWKFIQVITHIGLNTHQFLDIFILAVLLVIMLTQMWQGSRILLAYPKQKSAGTTIREVLRESRRRLYAIFLYTLVLTLVIGLLAGGVQLLSALSVIVLADLFVQINVEILIACVQGPVSPIFVFLTLMGFSLMMLQVGLLLMAGSGVFVLGTARSLQIWGERRAARSYKQEFQEPAGTPQLKKNFKTMAVYLIKVSLCTLGVWVAARASFSMLGLKTGSIIVAAVMIFGFGYLMLRLKVHRLLVRMAAEWLTGTRFVRRLDAWEERWKKKDEEKKARKLKPDAQASR